MNPLKSRKRSEIWSHFQAVDENFAKCNICKDKVSYKTSTSNLTRHMERRHPTVALPRTTKTYDTARCQQTTRPIESRNNDQVQLENNTDSTVLPLTSTNLHFGANQPNIQAILGAQKLSKKSKEIIDRQILKLFYCDYQPFRIVEDAGFKELINALNPAYELPSRHTLSRTRIPALYEECRVKAMEFVSQGTTFCITTDCWTSKANTSFLAVTAHFLSSDFKLHSVLLECCPANYSHTSNYLAEELNRIVNDWSISKKILLAVSDNAANIKSAICTNLKWKHFGCLAHTLNLIVKEGLKQPEITLLIDRVKRIVTHFKRSTTSNAVLMRYQRNAGGEALNLLQDVDTRWNSTLLMVQRFVKLQDAVKSSMALIEVELPSLSAVDWEVLNHLCLLLKPFEDATTTISGENYCTAALVIPLTNGLTNVYKHLLQQTFPSCIKCMLQTFSRALSERFANMERSQSLQFATFLDPRFKTLAFCDSTCAENAKKICTNAVAVLFESRFSGHQYPAQREYPSSSTNPPSSTNNLSIWQSFDNIVSTHQPVGTRNSRAILEIQRYLEDEIIPRTSNPLEWWRNNKYKFPTLSIVAQEKLCALASSVPCERLFSVAGQILTDRRSSLSDNKLHMLVFLNSNFKHTQ